MNSESRRPVGTVPRSAWQVAAVVVVGAFMTQLDAALVNVGLATIAGKLGAELGVTNWIVSAYLLALVISLPLCGWLSRRVGAARLWMGALAGFTAVSALCAMAPNIQTLIVFRALQGLLGGLLLPAGQTVIAQVAGRAAMGRVMSTAGMALVLGPAAGPTVGGLLIAHASWPWLFLINVPIGLIGLWLGYRLMPRGGKETTPRFDTGGFLLIGLGLPLVTFSASQVGSPGGGARVAVPLVIGAVVLAVFVRRSLRTAGPLLRTSLFANRAFAAAGVASFLAGAIQFGGLTIWALYFQLVLGDDVVGTGLSMIGFAVGAATLPLTGWLTDRFGGGPIAVAGALVTILAVLPMTLMPASAGLAALEACLLVLGIGNAMSVVPVSTAGYVTVDRSHVPDAVVLTNIALRLGGAVGAALLVAVLDGSSAGSVTGQFHAAFRCLAYLAGGSLVAAALLSGYTRPPKDSPAPA